MLIVIVIIGILAAALIPRLASARGRADDVARKADLAQVASALVSYQIDHWSFPSDMGSLATSGIAEALINAWMSSIPTDPNSDRNLYGINGALIASGQFWYTPIKKSWVSGGGFVVMAAVETEWGANWVASWTTIWNLSNGSEYNTTYLCKTFKNVANTTTLATATNSECTYDKNLDQLRYIYMY